MYDVIVIGAGPSGCCAAKTLAEKGYNVLIAEKFKLPRYKSCSGQLIKKSIDLVKLYFGEDIPRSVTCAPTENKGMVFTDDKGREFRFEQSGLNVWRSAFDNFLADLAVKAGATLSDGSPVTDIAVNGGEVAVSFRDKTERAKCVIDCEGVVGTVKRKLTTEKAQYVTTYQTFNEGSINLDPHYFYAYLQPELSEYDAWFNVKDGQIVLGVSVLEPKNIKLYYERLISYMIDMHKLKIDRQIKVDKWLMPRVLPDFKINYGVDKVLFAGEVAGFLNPMGEGISVGLESGYHAACAVINNFDNINAAIAEYKDRTKPLYEYMKRQWQLIANMTETFKEYRP